jgi:hypothetical protein
MVGEALSKIDEDFVALPEDEQVARGQELMTMLKGQEPSIMAPADSKDSSDKTDKSAEQVDKSGWNVIVKQTFIEVVIPPCHGARRRTMSEPSFSSFEETETPLKIASHELSDASTNDSGDEDLDANLGNVGGWSSDDEEDIPAPSTSAYNQYMESWWMPMGCTMGAAAMWPVTPAGFDQTGMNFDASVFAPMQWMEPSMGAVECHGSDSSVAEPEEWRSTVMIRNMPNNYTREMLLELVDLMGFAGTYDFVYLPIDFQSQAGLGYAFINFASVADALRCFDRFEGFSDWKVPSEKVCTITWSSPTQGLEAHLERYRNSPVMHHSLADDWKPVLFQMGRRVAFPPPTKPIKTPKVRQQAPKAGFA